MSDKPKGKSGRRPAEDRSGEGRKSTLPMGFKVEDLGRPRTEAGEDDTVPAAEQPNPDSSAPSAPNPSTFPPNAWDRQENLVTSAKTSTVSPQSKTAGSVSLSGERLSEAVAREVLQRSFTGAGLAIQPDYQFYHGNTLVVLDGFDPNARIGYQYISHADADVVTDHDVATEMALKELSAAGQVKVLVIHDVDAPTGDDLLSRIREFLGKLGFEPPGE